MSGYTYKWNANREITPTNSYKRNELEKMTMFHLREICRKERLVVSSVQREDKESLIRLIMRFRGQKEYRISRPGAKTGWSGLRSICNAMMYCLQTIWISGCRAL